MANILIIGCSTGIGSALSNLLIAQGHKVFGTYYSSLSSQALFARVQELNVLDEALDISFAPDKLDGLVYCPGDVKLKPFVRVKPSDFISDYQLQVVGAVKVIQACLPKLKNAADPSIVLFSPVAVQTGFNFHSLVAASKGAVEGLTKALAAEFAPKIRINCIAPSVTEAPMAVDAAGNEEKVDLDVKRHHLKKIAKSEDLANLAEFLLSDKSSWITGQIIHAGGGISSLKL